MNDTEVKPQKGHIATACKAIQKQIDKYNEEINKLQSRKSSIDNRIDFFRTEIEGLAEQILKLKG